jgi:hypothetical protein
MTAVMEQLASGTTAITQTPQQKEETATLYTKYQVAVIKGYCGLRDMAAIPIIWARFQTSKHTEDHRNGTEINHGVFFLKETIEDIVKLRPNPGDGHHTLKTAKRGVSILACLPRKQNEILSWKCRRHVSTCCRDVDNVF